MKAYAVAYCAKCVIRPKWKKIKERVSERTTTWSTKWYRIYTYIHTHVITPINLRQQNVMVWKWGCTKSSTIILFRINICWLWPFLDFIHCDCDFYIYIPCVFSPAWKKRDYLSQFNAILWNEYITRDKTGNWHARNRDTWNDFEKSYSVFSMENKWPENWIVWNCMLIYVWHKFWLIFDPK